MAFPESSFARAGDFSHIRLIGHGSGGNVYYAIQQPLGRNVAVKEALPQSQGFAATQRRFHKEAQIHARLNHPNIIQIYDLRQDPQTGEQYLICEYANAGSLADTIRSSGPLSEPEAIQIVLDLCAALEAVWAQRIVHRDLKPANILLCMDSRNQRTAKLADFGVARDFTQQPTTDRGSYHPGTPHYMAPEQADISRPVDVRTDLYALGICLWEMLTGTDYKLVQASGSTALHTFNPQASPDIAQVIARTLHSEPVDRYQTPQEMTIALRDVLQGRPLAAPMTIQLPVQPAAYASRTMRRGLALLIILALTLLAGWYWLWSPPWSYTREAENPDVASVGMTIPRSQASNAHVHGQFGTLLAGADWSAQPGAVEYHHIRIPAYDHLYLNLRYSKHSAESTPIIVFLDAESAARAAILPLDQGDWNKFTWTGAIDLGPVTAGVHTITFVTSGEAFGVADLDSFTLTSRP